MPAEPQDFLTHDISHPHHRRAIAVLVIALVIFGGLLVWYSLNQSNKNSTDQSQLTAEEIAKPRRLDELQHMSDSLTVQAVTPEFKKQLKAISASLNK